MPDKSGLAHGFATTPVKLLSLVFILSLLSAPSFAAQAQEEQPFKLNKDRMNVAGRIWMPMSVNRHGETHIGLHLSPAFGLFFADQWELRFNFKGEIKQIFSEDHHVAAPFFWGASVDALHFFKTRYSLWPYIGAGLGFSLMGWNVFSFGPEISLPLGVLIAIDKNIAIDIAMPVSVKLSFRSLSDVVSFPLGVVGIRYYF